MKRSKVQGKSRSKAAKGKAIKAVRVGRSRKGEKTSDEKVQKPATDGLKGTPKADDKSLPRFTVTATGSLPKVLTGIALKKGPIAARDRESAIARFMSWVVTQFKNPETLDIETVDVEEVGPPIQPSLPYEPEARGPDTPKEGA